MSRSHWRRSLVASAVACAMLPSAVRAEIEEVIVTAQKRKESVQEVPIAVTAFDQSALKAQQISTFGDVRFAAPNVAYTKDNFTGNNFQIRGVGTSVLATAYDDGVGIHVNEVPIWYPRLFETEYFDIEQIAILRGPQGTLYGRNSTGGAVNMITKTAQTGETEGYVEGQYGDYDHTQFEGALNVPLGDSFALRFAGLYLERDGYTDNVYTGNDVDGRDQYSVRASLRWEPGEHTTIDLMASYFDEDSSRTRSQKQLCKNDPSGLLGCLPDELAYETVNPLAQLTGLIPSQLGPLGPQPGLTNDPSENPRNLRKVYADFDPTYEADETLVTLHLEHAFEDYTLDVVAGYQDTSVLSQQDYNWNVSPEASVSPLMPFIAPKTYAAFFADGCLPISAPSKSATGIVGGHIADCGSRLDAYDQSNQDTDQHSIEVRLASNYAGAFNFLAGAFYMEADTEQQYWIMATGLDYFSVVLPAVPVAFGGPLGIDGFGFVSPNFVINTKSYELESSAIFGEVYYDLTDELKLTLGARYTVDKKDIEDVQYLFNTFVPFGFDDEIPIPNREDDEEWKETTGRVVLDWMPDLDSTDSTLVYASYSRGYKGGGFNPPFDPAVFPNAERTFDPEYVNAFEIGTKNRLLDNRLQANLTAFFYDYEGLQVSKLVNRSAFNENADAEIYGMEAEFLFAPDTHWRFNANLAYLKTEVQDFDSIDPRDPTNGRDDVTLIKDAFLASNCVVNHNGAPPPGIDQVSHCYTDQFGPGLNDTLPAPYTVSDGVAVDLDGNELQNSPEWTVSLGAEYTFDLAGGYELSTRVDYYWQDEMYGRIYNRDPIDKIDDWDIWNAQATLSCASQNWYVRAFIKNIEDDDNIVGMFVQDATAGLFTNVFTIEPRTYGLAAGYNF